MAQNIQTFTSASDLPQGTITRMSIISALPDQVFSKLGDESVILNVKTGKYFGLNDVGSRIWSLIQQSTTLSTVVQTLLDEYDVDPKQCEEEVLNLLKDLVNAALIEVKNENDSQVSTVSP